MEKYDIDLINQIIELTKKIFKIYNTLYELEINNQKDSELYKKNLKYLDVLTDLENELYEKIPSNKLDEYRHYSNRAILFRKFSDFTLIINDFCDLYIFKRIYNRLVIKEISINIKKYQNDEPFEDSMDNYDIANIIYQIIDENVLESFSFETTKLSNNISNDDYKNALLMIKYLVSFLNQDIEKKHKTNFDNDNKLLLSNRILVDLFNYPEKEYQKILVKYFERNVYNELKAINNKETNEDYSFQNYRLLLQICLIKAFNNINDNNFYLKKKIYDIISMNNLDIDLCDTDNIMNIRSERLILDGISK